MAEIVSTERYQRGMFGTLTKWAFIAFNVLMLVWVVGGFNAVSNIAVHSDAERVGRAIGSAFGIASLLMLWMIGDVILGILVLVTRGNKVITQTVGSSFGLVPSYNGEGFNKVDELIAQFQSQQS